MMGEVAKSSETNEKLMILESDSSLLVASSEPTLRGRSESLLLRYQLPIAFCIFLACVVTLQALSGAYRSEFSAYPDEPAHFVTSLMICDYVRHFSFQSPIKFAEFYYQHYPKVALGHWPPVFYLVQAAWMLVFGPSRVGVRVEIALTTALLALSVFREFRRVVGWAPALAAGSLCVALPLVQTYSSEEMAEVMLTLFCFWSTIFFARFLDVGSRRNALYFGLFFSLAVLTKGSGWLLAMVPPLSLLFLWRAKVVLRPAFWLPVILVAVLCLPWQLATMRMAERGWEGGSHPTVQYTSAALWQFVLLFPEILGPVLCVAMLLGLALRVVKPIYQRNLTTMDAAMVSLLLAVWIFHSLVPAGVEDRKLLIGVPAMIYFVVAGAIGVARYIPEWAGTMRIRGAMVGAALTCCFFLQTFSIPRVRHYGFDKVAAFISSHPGISNSRILVSSDSVGEGLLVSELAMLRPDPAAQILRATKALATVDWNGDRYRCLYRTAPELTSYLQHANVDFVVVDSFPKETDFLHDRILRRALGDEKVFKLIAAFPSHDGATPGEIQIYNLKKSS